MGRPSAAAVTPGGQSAGAAHAAARRCATAAAASACSRSAASVRPLSSRSRCAAAAWPASSPAPLAAERAGCPRAHACRPRGAPAVALAARMAAWVRSSCAATGAARRARLSDPAAPGLGRQVVRRGRHRGRAAPPQRRGRRRARRAGQPPPSLWRQRALPAAAAGAAAARPCCAPRAGPPRGARPSPAPGAWVSRAARAHMCLNDNKQERARALSSSAAVWR